MYSKSSRLLPAVALALLGWFLIPTAAHAFGYCAGGDGATDGRPNYCNFAYVGGSVYQGKRYPGNNHWWAKLYWNEQSNLTTLRNDGKARLEIELYNPGGSSSCDKFKFASPALRHVTFPNWRHFKNPPKNGCGSGSIEEEWKIEFTNAKAWRSTPTDAYQLSIDMVSQPPMSEGLEINLSWVRVRPLWPDPDLWLGKLANFCDHGGGVWAPREGHPGSKEDPDGTLGFVHPPCPTTP